MAQFFRKRSVRIAASLLALSVLIAVLVFVLYQDRDEHAKALLERAASAAGVDMQIGEASIDVGGSLELRDVDLGALGHIDFIELGWGWKNLTQSRISMLRVHGLELRSSELQKLQKKDTEAAVKKEVNIRPFILDKLILGQAVLVLDDLGAGIPPIPVRLGEVTPLYFENLHLGGETSDPAASELQKVEIHDLVIYSPYDAMAEVLSFEKITLVFSWAGIQSRQIDRLTIENPLINVGEDLFWLVDEIQKQDKLEKPAAVEQMPWSLGTFSVEGGRLRVTALGNPGFTLPIIYEMEQNGLVLADFANAPLKMNLKIPPTNLNYPEYGVRVSNMNGEMAFSLPPGEGTVDNIVNTVFMDSISWKGVTATKAWVSITFDKEGIYAKLGGESYGGYTEGNLSIMVNEGMKWAADASVTDTEVSAIAEKLAPEYIAFDGPVSGSIEVSGSEQNIVSAKGEINWNEPGKLTVFAVDDLLKKLPEDWYTLKKDATTIALNAFRDYDYYQGSCRFSFYPPQSFIDLQFDGEQGERNFLINWSDLRASPGFGW